MSKHGFGQMYRRLSSKLLDLVVTPHVLGEVPAEPTPSAASEASHSPKIVCYVLQNYSRSNALVVDSETRRLHLKPALDPYMWPSIRKRLRYCFYSIMMSVIC